MKQRMHAFVLLIAAFFQILFAGYIRFLPRNRIFLDRYYTASRDVRQSFDLAFPRSASGSTGLVLCIHGGGWVSGSKDDYTGQLMRMSAEHGVAAACMNYRYVSEAVSFDDVLDDVSAALRAIRETGAAYGVSFDRVLLTGVSAGGHISLLYAYSRKDSAPVKPVCVVELCGPTDFENAFYYSDDNSVNHAVGSEYLCGILSHGVGCPVRPDDLDAARPALRKSSPINFIDENTVPTVFGHGEQDAIVPYGNAVDLDARLTAYGVEHTFVSFPDSGHGCEDKASMSRIMALFFNYADKYLK